MTDGPPQIQALAKRHISVTAELHRHGIRTGFLSSLGPTFLRQLYRAILACPAGFGFAWEETDGQVLGFIACAVSTKKLFRQSLLRRGLALGLPLVRYLLRPFVVKRIWQTLRYPVEWIPNVPPAEILSIVVDEKARGRGVGKALMKAALEEFARRGIDRVRVAVWAGNETANAFYRGCGFELSATVQHHGLPMNIYVKATGA